MKNLFLSFVLILGVVQSGAAFAQTNYDWKLPDGRTVRFIINESVNDEIKVFAADGTVLSATGPQAGKIAAVPVPAGKYLLSRMLRSFQAFRAYGVYGIPTDPQASEITYLTAAKYRGMGIQYAKKIVTAKNGHETIAMGPELSRVLAFDESLRHFQDGPNTYIWRMGNGNKVLFDLSEGHTRMTTFNANGNMISSTGTNLSSSSFLALPVRPHQEKLLQKLGFDNVKGIVTDAGSESFNTIVSSRNRSRTVYDLYEETKFGTYSTILSSSENWESAVKSLVKVNAAKTSGFSGCAFSSF